MKCRLIFPLKNKLCGFLNIPNGVGKTDTPIQRLINEFSAQGRLHLGLPKNEGATRRFVTYHHWHPEVLRVYV